MRIWPVFRQHLPTSRIAGFILGALAVLAAAYGTILLCRVLPFAPVGARSNSRLSASATSRQFPAAENAAQAGRRALAAYGKLPLKFEANSGQTDSRVKFVSRGPGYSLFLTGNEAVLSLRSRDRNPKVEIRQSKWEKGNGKMEDRNRAKVSSFSGFNSDGLLPRSASAFSIGNRRSPTDNSQVASPEFQASPVLRMKLAGANANARATGLDELPGRSNYFIGNDPAKWRTNVSNFSKVKYEAVYPGIDLVYYGNLQQLEYDFVVAPGADPQAIAMEIGGAEKVEINAAGDLVLQSSAGDVRMHKPVVYQKAGARAGSDFNQQSAIGSRQFVEGQFVLTASNQVRFELGPYDKSRPLVIDPYVSYLAYLGGGLFDYAYGVAVDGDGSAYVTGSSSSSNFPTVNAFQSALSGTTWEDVFVAKIDPSGSSLIYSTYLGGLNTDTGYAIAVDASGNAYVTGWANSLDFPTTAGSYNANDRGAFITKLNPTGDGLVYSVLLGEGTAAGIAVDSTGRAYVTGSTYQYGFPTTPGAYDTDTVNYHGEQSFLTIVNTSGSALAYSTFLGGTGDENFVTFTGCTEENGAAGKLAIDSSGMAYITGFTSSLNFPTTTGAFQTSFGGGTSDAFVAKLNPAGNGAADLVYSTYLGGTATDYSCDIAVDPSGNAYVAGQTGSSDFPVVQGSYQTTFTGGLTDVFVSKLNSAGSALVYSTYLGGTLDGWFEPKDADESAEGIAVDSSGSAYVTGWTEAADFPIVDPVQPRSDNLCWDIFVTKLAPDGSGLEFSTTLGTYFDFDWGFDIALDSSGSMYVVGPTTSTGFLVTTGNFNLLLGNNGTYNGGAWDAFVTKINHDLVPQIGASQIRATFPDQEPGTTSSPLEVTVGNYTSTPIDMTEVHIVDGDGNPSMDFGVDFKDCIRTLAVGQTCTLIVTFNPGGSQSSSSSVLDAVSKALRSGGSGSRPADTTPSIISLTGTLTTKTTLTGTTKTSTIPLTGNMLLPVISLLPESLNFTDQFILSQSSPQTITVSNGGLASLTISSVGLSGTDIGAFSLSDGCTGHVLSPLGTCSISVTFAPTTLGDKSASLSIASNAPSSPSTIGLAGRGVPAGPGEVSPAALDFDAQQMGSTSLARAVTLINGGTNPLAISGFNLSGGNSGDFALSSTCPLAPSTLAGGSNCAVNVTFTPTAAKPRKALLRVNWNASTGPRRVMLTGMGAAIGVSPSSLTFASRASGTTSSPQSVTVHNYGASPVAVWSSALNGANKTEFSRVNGCPAPPATLAANVSCSITVQFSPASAGAKSAKLLISYDGAGSPGSVSLTGTGTAAFKSLADGPPVLLAPVMAPRTEDMEDSPTGVKRKAGRRATRERHGPQ